MNEILGAKQFSLWSPNFSLGAAIQTKVWTPKNLYKFSFTGIGHHPYIIHNIPWENWQIVSRNGSDVKVTKATHIPELDTASSLDKFTQLVNLPEYEGGIS